MATDPCPHCGLNMALREIGRRHNCPPHLVAALQVQRQAHTASANLANVTVATVANADCLANGMANASPQAPGRNRASITYRYRNPDKRRAYMATYMRTYRKRARAA